MFRRFPSTPRTPDSSERRQNRIIVGLLVFAGVLCALILIALLDVPDTHDFTYRCQHKGGVALDGACVAKTAIIQNP